jgi:tRNA pseudouridine55 synthase
VNRLKYKYKTKKVGFSGTLDPFAKGALIIGFGQYPKLFQYIAKTPKRYRAVLWLGAFSEGLDTENIEYVKQLEKCNEEEVKKQVEQLCELTSQVPPKFCAKWIDGKRAYDLARKGKEVNLPSHPICVHEAHFIHYCHPYITFEVSVSQGTYVRSLGATIAENLGTFGSLCALERLSEGKFTYDDEVALNPIPYLDMPRNELLVDESWIKKGLKLRAEFFKNCDDGVSYVEFEDSFSIIEFENGVPKYKLNIIQKMLDKD